jgi:23S rRNA (uridine2552-2'-O)-methyltransferase
MVSDTNFHMSNRPSSKRWLQRRDKDPYVRRAQSEGWRSRAVFKLIEIQERNRLIKPGQTVLDLGAAPGAWSQYAKQLVGGKGRVIAVDRLEMEPLDGVEIIQGDFREQQTLNEILDRLKNTPGNNQCGLVMSDLAPNISGNRSVDQPKAMDLAELALAIARQTLEIGGSLVIKLFHGEGFDDLVRDVRRDFGGVRVRKPAASRLRSRETYLTAQDYRL